jgi:antiviral helicase SKI2
VAEYGIALGKRNAKRVLYTSPIKALSNQKYREFKKKFGDVGILTGDVSINPDAQCLIMTTEILQSSLYKNSELLNQVEWVIFDEIHYINDNERGHVWEEILILMPRGIGIIMLSATVPNYMEFAQWVGDIKETKVYVQNTLKRVVPLQHQLFVDKDNVFKVKEKDKIYKNRIEQAFNILENNKYGKRDKYYLKDKENEYLDNITYFDKYKIKKRENWRKRDKYQKNYNKKSNQSNPKITKMHYKIEEIVDYLDNNDLCPAVIFVFSIKRITEYSKMLSLKNLVPRKQQNEISNFFRSVVSTMPPEDRKIPQVKELEEILQSGIGVHHAGLLPILKEAIEVLYSRGLIKILFATTSFSIGLNMPTRTVVFTDLYKYNDTSRVILSSSEYLQMCGRAGRRGIDTIGNVFILLSELSNDNEMDDVIGMLEGKGDDVVSKFRLCYRTLLSFFSRNLKDMNRFFRESFLESNMAQKIPEKLAEIETLKSKQKMLSIMNCPYESDYVENKKKQDINNDDSKNNENNNIIIDNKNNIKKEITIEDYPIADYFRNLNKYKNLSREIFSNQKIYDKLHKFPGRILKVRKDIRAPKSKKKRNKGNNEAPKIDDGIYVMLIHAYTEDNYFGSLWCLGFSGFIKGTNKNISYKSDLFVKKGTFGNYKFFYREYKLEDVIEAYEYPFEVKLKGKKNDSFWKKDKEDYYYIIDRPCMKKCLKELARLKPRGDLELFNSKISFAGMNFKELVKDLDFLQKVEERQKTLEESKSIECLNCINFYEHYEQYQKYEEVSANIDKLKGELNPENLAHYHEFEIRLKILQNLEYVNDDNSLTLKGKAAREIGTTDCVIITELLTSDILTSLKEEDVIGFIAGFASNKNEIETNDPSISREFSTAIKKFNEIYTMIYELEKENDFEENKYNRRMTFEFSEAMRSWMAGKDFLEILNLTELEEGKLYNLIMRIFLMLEEISNFYSVLGNVEQSKRFSELKAKLMRGIMAIQSLYLQEKIDIDSIGNERNTNSRHK